MRFHKLDECTVGVFDVGKIPCGFAHVETAARIHRKGVTGCRAAFLHLRHANDVETQVDETEITPEAVFKNFPWIAVKHLHEFDFTFAQEFTESSLAWFAVAQQHAAVPAEATVDTLDIGKNAGDIVSCLVVTQDVAVKGHGFFHVGHADDCAIHTAGIKGQVFGEPVVGAHDFVGIAPGILYKKVLVAIGTFCRVGQDVHTAFAQVVEAGLHVFAFHLGGKNAQIAELWLKRRGHGRAAGVLPNFESAPPL